MEIQDSSNHIEVEYNTSQLELPSKMSNCNFQRATVCRPLSKETRVSGSCFSDELVRLVVVVLTMCFSHLRQSSLAPVFRPSVISTRP